MFDVGKVGQVVGGQDLALHSGEINLQYLVDPTGVHWQRDEGGVGRSPCAAERRRPCRARAYTEVITRVADATSADDFGVRHAALAEKFPQEEILEIIAIVINMTSAPD